MGILEQVVSMKRGGISDSEIINQLSHQGNSPYEISNALKQAEIKNAVSGYSENEEEMQPSIMPSGEAPQPIIPGRNETSEEVYTPTEETYAPQQQYTQPTTDYQPRTQEPQYYPQTETYQEYTPTGNADTMIEIADQVFSEKIRKLQKVIETTSETAILLQNKFENLSERVKKIENIIDKLQIAILEKVGSYGQNLESIKKEMTMMQDSFSKVISSPKHKEESTHKKSSNKK